MKSSVRFASVMLAMFVSFATCGAAFAQTQWQNGGNGLWSNSANWTNGVPDINAPVLFDSTGVTTVNLGGVSNDLQSLNFDFGAQAYTLTGNAGDMLNFASNGFINKNAGATSVETINSVINLNGPFTVTNDDTGLLTLGGAISGGAAGVLTVNGTGDTTIDGSIGAGAIGQLVKSGAGTLTLGAANSYTGETTILGGTLQANVDGGLGGSNLVFGDRSAATGSLVLNGNETVPLLLVQSNSATANTLSIASGKTLTVNGNVQVGVNSNSLGYSGMTNNFVATGGGTLTFAGSTVDIGLPSTSFTTVDLTGLAAFTSTATTFRIGVGQITSGTFNNSTIDAKLYLSNTSNTITASTLTVNDSLTRNGSPALLQLGAGTNVLNVDTITVGQGKGGPGTIQFASQAPSSPGTVTIAGQAGGSSTANIILGRFTGTGSPVVQGILDLRGHTATVAAGTLTMGTNTGAGTGAGAGVVYFDGGTFTVNSLLMAQKSGTSGNTSTGDLFVSAGTFTVNSTFTMGNQTGSGAAATTMSITGGSVVSNTNIVEGAGNVNATITLDGGTLDLTGHNIGGSGAAAITNLNFNSGTVQNVAQINNGAGLTKNTAGTLFLVGNNTYTGGTTINGGTVSIGNGGSTGSIAGNVTFAAPAVLQFDRNATYALAGAISGSGDVTFVNSGGVVSLSGTNSYNGTTSINQGTVRLNPTAAETLSGITNVADGKSLIITPFNTSTTPVTLGTLNLGTSTGSNLGFELTSTPSAVPLATTTFATTGTNLINVAASGTLAGQFPLISYSGSIGGSGFAGLTLGTLPTPRTVANLVNNTLNHTVDLNISGTPDTIRWNGGISNVWNISSLQNWKTVNGGALTNYLQPTAPGDVVTFNDLAAANYTVNVTADVTPASVTFSNSSHDYILSGANTVTTASFNTTGSRDVTITNAGLTVTTNFTINSTGAGKVTLANSGGLLSLPATLHINSGTLALNRTDDLTVSNVLVGSGALRKENANIVTLSGNNSGFSGPITVATGTLKLGLATALGTGTTNVASGAFLDLNGNTLAVGTGGVTLTGTGDVTTTTTGQLNAVSSVTIPNNITGAVSVNAAASGSNVTLSGNNTYSGGTTIVDSTVTLGAHNAAGSGDLIFGDGSTSATGNLNLGAFDQTSSTLTAQSNTATANIITIGSGKTLTLSGGSATNVITVGGLGSVIPNTRLNVTGASGTLAVSDAAHNIVVSQLGPTDGVSYSPATLDLSGLGTFNATVANIYVARPTTSAGAPSNSAASDTLLLANQNNITVGGNIAVGGTNLSVGGMTGTIRLGTTNILNVAQWIVGNGRVSGTVNFNDGLTNPAVSLYGAGGNGTRTNIILGDQANATGVGNAGGGSSPSIGTMDFTGGTITALIENLLLGNGAGVASNTRAQGNGIFTFGGAGSSVDVNTVVIGVTRNDNTNSSANNPGTTSFSTLTVNDGTFVVNSAFTIANDVDDSNTPGGIQDVVGTFNVNGGAATIGSIATPVDAVLGIHTGANTGNATATINVNGGSMAVHGNVSQGTIGSGTINATVNVASGTMTTDGAITIGTAGGITSTSVGSISVGSGAAVLAGDYNNDGSVNAADFVVWRKTINTGPAYALWRAHFGETGGGGFTGTLTVGGTTTTDTLNLNNGTLVSAGDVTVATSLTGNGTINGNVVMGFPGDVSPGVPDIMNPNTTGKLTVSNGHNLTLSSGGTVTMDLNSATPVTGFDQLFVAGQLAADGILQVNLNFTPTGVTQFKILDFASISGLFSVQFNTGSWDPSALYTTGIVTYTSAGSGSGSSLDATGVPEPATLALLALGVAGLACGRSRRRR